MINAQLEKFLIRVNYPIAGTISSQGMVVSTLLLVLSLPFSQIMPTRWASIAIMGMGLFWLIGLLHPKTRPNIDDQISLILAGLAYFLPLVLSAATTSNFGEFGYVIGVKLGFLFLPLIFAYPFSKHQLKLIAIGLIIGNLLSGLWMFREGSYFHYPCPSCALDILGNLHRPYLAMYFFTGAAISFYYFLKATQPIEKGLFLLSVLMNCGLLAVSYAKMSYLAAGFAIVAVVIAYILKLKLSTSKVLPLVLIFSCLPILLGAFANPFNGDNLSEKGGGLIELFEKSLQYRLEIWASVFDGLSSNFSWLFGIGAGDVLDYLKEFYCRNSLLTCDKVFNTHWQAADSWLAAGIIGFMGYGMFFSSFISNALKSKSLILLALGVFYLSSCLSENYFSRDAGLLHILFWLLWAAKLNSIKAIDA